MPSTNSRKLSALIRPKERFIPVLETTGPNNTVEIGTADIKQEQLETLQGIPGAITNEASNEFPVSLQVGGKTSLRDGNGLPAGLSDPAVNGQSTYLDNYTETNAKILVEQTSRSGMLDIDGNRFDIKKGKENNTAPTGQEIYNEVNELGEKAPFVQRVRQVQLDNNRFTVGKTFIPRNGLGDEGVPGNNPGGAGSGVISEDDSNLGIGYSQEEFGKWGPRKFPDIHGNTATLVKLKDLKKLGLLTMLQASGEYYIPNDPEEVGQQVAARGASLAPGLARIGQKIDISRTSATKIMKTLNPNYQKINLEDNLKKDPVLSYGNVNNWMVPFAGLNSTASVAGAALLSLTIGGLIKSAAVLIGSRRPSTPIATGANLPTNDRRKRLGSYLGKANEVDTFRNTDFDIQITQTNHDYFQAVSRGVNIFFGTGNVGLGATKLAQNHGYYNTILRSIVRNTTDILLQASGRFVSPKDKDKPISVQDVTLLGNPLGPIELVQKLNGSQLLKFCNILAAIGDIALNHEESGFTLDADGGIDEHISEVDRFLAEAEVGPNRERSLNPAVLQSIHRLPGEYRNALAWGSNTSKSMYLIPNGLFRAETKFLAGTDQSRNPSEAMAADLTINNLHKVKGPEGLLGNRIAPEDVKAIEEHLEADYMPFYFHDLRTNEIISFHAFLESVNDSFDPEYTDVEGYGRIGKVQIYKNTQRNISLEFRVVATNPKDFDHMWFKIDKLVSLVYPQYTEGRQVGTATNKFIQPFSQVPSASPLIRLRLGDVFKSNYSKFALARLFGVGSSQFSLEGEQGTIRYNAALLRNREQIGNRMGREGEYNVGEFAMITRLPFQAGRGAGRRPQGYPRLANINTTPSQPGQSQRRGRGGSTGAGTGFLSITGANSPGGRSTTPVQSIGENLVVTSNTRVQIVRRGTSSNGTKTYRFVIPNGGIGQDGIYGCTQYDLIPDPNEITRLANNQSSSQNVGTTRNTPNVITTFFDSNGDNGNSIVKAFESTKGRGLAGFIKGLRFDWSQAIWETGRQNARAPMMVKVSIEFSPIHDINPGLDSEGFRTAPVYNVGDTMKSFTEMPDEANQNLTDRANMGRALLAALPRTSNGSTNTGSGNGGVGSQ